MSLCLFMIYLCVLLQDEDRQLRKRRNLPSADSQASSTGEPG